MFNFKSKSKNEKIYKFVYQSKCGWDTKQNTLLLTASSPVEAVRKFNEKTSKAESVNIIEFTKLDCKMEE